jgi:hypothetical protein
VQGCGFKEYNTSAIILARCSALSALTRLELNNAVLAGSECADVLKQGRIALPSLRALSLPRLHLDALNAQALSENLCNMTRLIELQVKKARMTTCAFVALAPAIANMRGLRDLGFTTCCVGNKGAKAVGEAPATIPAIRKISMLECEIGEVGAQAMLVALRESKVFYSLQALVLYENPTKRLTGSHPCTVYF